MEKPRHRKGAGVAQPVAPLHQRGTPARLPVRQRNQGRENLFCIGCRSSISWHLAGFRRKFGELLVELFFFRSRVLRNDEFDGGVKIAALTAGFL
ncbi:MAG: hypothetical protein K9M45_13080 [Kiritimatiellales bacterium]|nr:hypothetical protein [Kiritimatiellales bacterium]